MAGHWTGLKQVGALFAAGLLAACSANGAPLESASAGSNTSTPLLAKDEAQAKAPVTILVSIDGFHPDYLARGLTPTLSRLAADGVSGPMRSSFPTKTFPNHWTIVTGKVPDEHGITANRMEDPRRPGEVFTMATVDPWWWSEAKPIWVEAEQAGIRTGNMFWPGSAVAWGGRAMRYGPAQGGTMSSDWVPFSMQVTNTQRVNTVLDWMRRPADLRPRFVTLYFDVVDSAGHDSGPDGEAIPPALRDVDEHIAMLVEGLDTLNQPANLVITSDHGMAPTSSEWVVPVDEVLEQGTYVMVESGAYATFRATEGNVEALEARLLASHDHMQCWRKEEIPARYQYGTHIRIPPYFCLPETGWSIFASRPGASFTGGNHGYDPFDPEMTALFIANGPAFAAGSRVEEFQNTAIAPLLKRVMGLPYEAADVAMFDAVVVE